MHALQTTVLHGTAIDLKKCQNQYDTFFLISSISFYTIVELSSLRLK